MGKTTVGKLKEMLVLETEIDGESSVLVIPKGVIIEISSEDEYSSYMSDEDLKNVVKYLKDLNT